MQRTVQLTRGGNIGTGLVVDGDQLLGIVSDRDIALLAVADGADTRVIEVGSACTQPRVPAHGRRRERR
ncbi:hypothetical protein [Streptomyces sp. NPDC059639]|uniref:hypothetical protein n=1 Tax=Streptomyces sp. NPDC059639 TaxID=3346891 RepID=UPI00367B3DC6